MTHQKQRILPYDDNYILICKQRFYASNLTIALMSELIAKRTGFSQDDVITDAVNKAVHVTSNKSGEEINQHIQQILETYN